jgi:glutathione S-transferase
VIIVHHLNNSRSQRILWMLEEMGVAYEIAHHKRDSVTRLAPPELLAVHPLGKSPVIVDDGQVVAESGAILEYLIERHGGGAFAPDRASKDWVAYVQWMHYAEGSAMLPLLLALYAGRLGDAAAPLWPRIQGEIGANLAFMEKSLEGKSFLVGDRLTAADVQVVFVLEAADANGALAAFPNSKRYLEALQARPAYKRAVEMGGPYDLGGNRS